MTLTAGTGLGVTSSQVTASAGSATLTANGGNVALGSSTISATGTLSVSATGSVSIQGGGIDHPGSGATVTLTGAQNLAVDGASVFGGARSP